MLNQVVNITRTLEVFPLISQILQCTISRLNFLEFSIALIIFLFSLYMLLSWIAFIIFPPIKDVKGDVVLYFIKEVLINKSYDELSKGGSETFKLNEKITDRNNIDNIELIGV